MAPLSGIRVLDLSWIIAGPLATRLLADFGAEVIKVESASRMDVGRANRVPLYGVLPGDANTNPDTGGYFQDVNAGKLSCTLDLGKAAGRELLRRLVAVSDAVVCNLGGDQLARWGVGYERARAINPGIIVVNMPTMASGGPRARWRGFGDMIAAVAGLKSVSGHPRGPALRAERDNAPNSKDPPLPFGHQYPDFSANPFHAAIALLAALHHRERTGEGQFIEVSQYESTIALLGASVLERTANGVTPQQAGNADPEAAPHNIYRCRGNGQWTTDTGGEATSNEQRAMSSGAKPSSVPQSAIRNPQSADAWCAITVFTDEQWHALTAIEGLEALRRPEYDTLDGRKRHEAQIDAIIEGWTEHWERQELAAFLQARGVPAGPYQHLPEIVHADPVLGDAHFARVAHPSGREFLVHRNPIQAHRGPPVVSRGPLLGEHTFAVLHDLLGLNDSEIAEYSARGAVE